MRLELPSGVERDPSTCWKGLQLESIDGLLKKDSYTIEGCSIQRRSTQNGWLPCSHDFFRGFGGKLMSWGITTGKTPHQHLGLDKTNITIASGVLLSLTPALEGWDLGQTDR